MEKDYNNCYVNVDREKLEKYKKVKNGFATAKTVAGLVGGTATVILVACPMDGPFGEIISLIATGVLQVAINAAEKIYDAAVDLPNPETDNMQNVNDMTEGATDIVNTVKQFADIIKPATEGGRSR